MTALAIIISILCTGLVALFVYIGTKTRPGGGGGFLPKIKLPSWITWTRTVIVVLLTVLGVYGYNVATNTWSHFFPEEEEKVFLARAEVSDTGEVYFSIPPIKVQYQNLIVFAKPWGVKFNKGHEPAIRFPRAELKQFNERAGEAGARWLSNKLGGDEKTPLSEHKGVLTGRQPGLPPNVLIIRQGSELHFTNGRYRHAVLVAPGAILGDFPHIRYTLKLAKEKK